MKLEHLVPEDEEVLKNDGTYQKKNQTKTKQTEKTTLMGSYLPDRGQVEH